MTEPLIQLKNITFSYTPKQLVLSGVNFELFPGERVGVIGPTGCGKTTFLHLLVGLLKPKSGVIRAFNKVRREEPDFYEVRIRAGLVFQDSDDQLFCPTVLEDIVFGPLNLGKTPEKAKEMAIKTLSTLGIKQLVDRITYKLSYGQKRLVALATVLAMQPDVLLLDEPTNGLDESSKQRITDILLNLPQAMIIISHETSFIETLATRTVRITSDGRMS